MEHSKNFEKVKGYYEGGYWNEQRIKVAVEKEWINMDEYKEITGKYYWEV